MSGLSKFKPLLDQHLTAYLDSLQGSIYEPASYILNLGGKRIRPSLLMAGMEAFGGDARHTLNQALAIEVFHNFTLVHDDVMDKADRRRGHETVHVKWNQDQAILSGDIMFAMANDLFIRDEKVFHLSAFKMFNDTASEVCVGQQMDMEFESRSDVSVDDYLEMIRLKTSVLLGASMAIGAIHAGAEQQEVKLAYDFAMHVGMAFQIQDDYLDTFGDSVKVGKRPGGDILRNKKTILLLKAREVANQSQLSELNRWYSTTEESEEKVLAVREIMSDLDIVTTINEQKRAYMERGLIALKKSQMSADWKAILEAFTEEQLVRSY